MLNERIESKWIDGLVELFQLCKVQSGEVAAVLSESQSRDVLVDMCELALARLDTRVFHVVLPSPPLTSSVPLRSTGTCLSIGGLEPVVSALAGSDIVIDCTVEGMLHSKELGAILKDGARLMMISNEHPEVLERLRPLDGLAEKCVRGAQMLTDARRMYVTSEAGSKLEVNLEDTIGRGSAGIADKPGSRGYWPAGLCLCFPNMSSVNGRLVLAPGDVNLTFKRYLETPITLTIENDYVVDISGDGLDAELMRSYYAAWNEEDAYAVSHVGWGMNPAARWDALVMYDRRDVNGTELRAFAGNFLFSTGANEHVGRFSSCHFDIPMRGCTVQLDDQIVVNNGVLQSDLSLAGFTSPSPQAA